MNMHKQQQFWRLINSKNQKYIALLIRLDYPQSASESCWTLNDLTEKLLMLTGMCPWPFAIFYQRLQMSTAPQSFGVHPNPCIVCFWMRPGPRGASVSPPVMFDPPASKGVQLVHYPFLMLAPLIIFWLVVYLHIPTPLKNMSSSVEIMKFTIYGKS